MNKTDKADKQEGASKQTAFVTTNPATGEVRQITAEDWKKNSAELIAGGFVRPNGIEPDDSGN